jgi:hypothetical protein
VIRQYALTTTWLVAGLGLALLAAVVD